MIDWRASLRALAALPTDSSQADRRRRGTAFEKVLFEMFSEAGFSPRLRYRPRGEEIDGSIWFEGRTILVEAKWTKDPQPASSLYSFRGKIDGKLQGTLGIFISMGGYSDDAIDALLAGKALNMVLFDGEDIHAIVDDETSILEALKLKLRAAGDSGTPFVPLALGAVSSDSGPSGGSQRLLVVEGRFDARVIEALMHLRGIDPQTVRVLPAGGPNNVLPLVDAIGDFSDGPIDVAIVVDDDFATSHLRADVTQEVDELGRLQPSIESLTLLVMAPDLDRVIGLAESRSDWGERRGLRRLSTRQLQDRLSNVDLNLMRTLSDELNTLLTFIGIGAD